MANQVYIALVCVTLLGYWLGHRAGNRAGYVDGWNESLDAVIAKAQELSRKSTEEG